MTELKQLALRYADGLVGYSEFRNQFVPFAARPDEIADKVDALCAEFAENEISEAQLKQAIRQVVNRVSVASLSVADDITFLNDVAQKQRLVAVYKGQVASTTISTLVFSKVVSVPGVTLSRQPAGSAVARFGGPSLEKETSVPPSKNSDNVEMTANEVLTGSAAASAN